jgi:hypothetical protein
VSAEPIALFRWIAMVTYRHDDRDETRIVSFEELHELHDIVEAGPNFYAIKDIIIKPSGRVEPRTVEMDERPEIVS